MNSKIDLDKVPSVPGCYLWKDKTGTVIYVGKSNNLKNRMKQYFNNKQTLKNSLLVKNIVSFEYITTIDDKESFLLETKLIHKYEPKYNIKVKNGSFSPYIVLYGKKQKILKVEYKLGVKKYDNIFGPFPIEFSPHTLVKILNETLPFNKCQKYHKNNPCLYYQMDMCLGHCVKTVTEEDYKPYVNKLTNFFKGDTKEIELKLEQKILDYSEKLNFEEAIKLTKSLKIVKKFSSSQIKTFNDDSFDLFAWSVYKDYLSISVSYVRFGSFERTDNFIYKLTLLNNSIEEIVENYISLFYISNKIPKKLLLMKELNQQSSLHSNVAIPKRGYKKKLLDLTLEDSKKRIEEQFVYLNEKAKRYIQFIDFLKLEMNISNAETFELIDISSFSGEEQVGVVVAFKNDEANKKMYRKYIISKDVTNNNDYGSIEEVVYRHFRNKLLNQLELPDVLIIDGGKGQINVAKKILNELNLNINLFALKKNKNHSTTSILFYKEGVIKEIPLKTLNLNIQTILIKMQEEVHRFAITFNRKRVSNKLFETSLSGADFLTKNDIKKLYENFGTIHEIINTNQKNIEKIIGKTKAKKLFDHFNKYHD